MQPLLRLLTRILDTGQLTCETSILLLYELAGLNAR
jgi:hypothetical protein